MSSNRSSIMTIFAAFLWLASFAGSESSAAQRVPSIADLIEARYVASDDRGVRFFYSPDQKLAAYVEAAPSIKDMRVHYRLRVVTLASFSSAADRVIYRDSSDRPFPAMSQIRWSADGRSIMFVERLDEEKSRLMRADLNGGSTVVMSFAGQIIGFDSAGGSKIFSVRQTPRAVAPGYEPHVVKGTLNEELGMTNPETCGLIHTFILRDGRRIPTREAPVSPTFYRGDVWISPDGNFAVTLRKAARIPAAWQRYQSSLPGYGLQKSSEKGEIGSYVIQYALIDLRSGTVRPLIDAPWGRAAVGSSGLPQALWSPDSRSVILSNTALPLDRPDTPDWATRAAAIAEVDIRTGRIEPVLPLPAFDAPSNETYVPRELKWIGERGDSIQLAIRNADGTPGAIRLQRGGRHWMASATRPEEGGSFLEVREDLNTPPELFVASPGSSRKVRDLNPQFAALRFGKASIVEWVGRDGYEWKAGLLLPPDYVSGRVYPLVIQTHGFDAHSFLLAGPSTTGYAAQALAARNIVVVQFPDRMDAWVTADEGPVMVEGFRSLIETLSARGLIRKDKVGLMGFSRSSSYVKQALVSKEISIAAAAVTDGVDHGYLQYLKSVNLDGGTYTREIETMNGGPPWPSGFRSWLDRLPGFHLDQVGAPLRIESIGRRTLLGEWEWYAGLRLLHKPVELVILPDDSHVLVTPAARLASSGGHVDWFDFWLNDHEDPGPAKADQYRRWRRMRD